MRGDYLKDREFKIEFQEQLNQLWLDKDLQLQNFASQAKQEG
jgi:DNA-dependent RNA polymerase auxiliary subunit epsilon